MSWTHEQTELLIELYKNHECLYVVKHKNYHNKHLRSLALQVIVEGLTTLRPNTTELEVQKKFQGLRTTYAAERRKQIESVHSGMSESEVYRPGLWYFKHMEFLNDHLNVRASKSNFSLPIESECIEQSGQESEVPEPEEFHELAYEVVEVDVHAAPEERPSSVEPLPTLTPLQPKKKKKISESTQSEINILKDVSASLNNMAGALRPTEVVTKSAEDTFGVLCNIDRLELVMPRYALKGGDVTLKCDHSVRPEHLHKVEWKKGDDKLFMYVKGRSPPFKAWEIPGAKLNTKNSSEKQIHLTNLTFAAGGSYYCVVSMETPSIFTKDSDAKDLTIIDSQDDDPKITFKKDTYYIGEMLEANCTTSPARPPPHITWLINDEKVRDSLTKSFSNGLVHGHGYFDTKAPSIKQLSIEVSQLHGGDDGRLRLTCMATIPGYVNNESDYADIRNATVDIEIMEESPALPSPVEAASSSCATEIYAILILKAILMARFL